MRLADYLIANGTTHRPEYASLEEELRAHHVDPDAEVALEPRHDQELIAAEVVAQLFHDTYERLAPEFGYTSRRTSAVPWANVPEPNKSLMIATAKVVLRELGLDEEGRDTHD